MPVLNQENSFKIVQSMTDDFDMSSVPDNWLGLLLEVTTPKGKSTKELHKNISKHLSTDSYIPYEHRDLLRSSMIWLYLYCMHNKSKLADNSIIKTSIYDGISDKVTLCPQGYHDRIERLILNLKQPESFDGLSSQYRFKIVEQVAMNDVEKNEDTVHRFNYFFTRASQLGIGVSAINSRDKYVVRDPQKTIDEKINLAIGKNYTFFGIALHIKNSIFVGLQQIGYVGTQESGYKGSFIGDALDLVRIYLDDIKPGNIYHYSSDGIIVDVNWKYIVLSILSNLLQRNYFHLTENDSLFLNKFKSYLNSEITEDDLLAYLSINFFVNNYDFISFINLMPCKEKTIKQKALRAYLRDKLYIIDLSDMLDMIKHFETYLVVELFRIIPEEYYKLKLNSTNFLVQILQVSPVDTWQVFFEQYNINDLVLLCVESSNLRFLLSRLSSDKSEYLLELLGHNNLMKLILVSKNLLIILPKIKATMRPELIENLIDCGIINILDHSLIDYIKILEFFDHEHQLKILDNLDKDIFNDKSFDKYMVINFVKVLDIRLLPVFFDIVGEEKIIRIFKTYYDLCSKLKDSDLSDDKKRIILLMPFAMTLDNRTSSVMKVINRVRCTLFSISIAEPLGYEHGYGAQISYARERFLQS